MVSSILENAAAKIARFNGEGLHYNLVAHEIYKMRDSMGDIFGNDAAGMVEVPL